MTQESRTADEIQERRSKIDLAYSRAIEWLPYATLAVSIALSPLISDRPMASRLVTLGLAAVTALWVYAMFTRLPAKTSASQWRMALYFFVMTGLGAALMSRDMAYFAFLITGFFHAGLLRPHWVLMTGIGATALVIDSAIVVGEAGVETVTLYLIVVAVQTLAVSSAFRLTDKMDRLSAEHGEALRAREIALEENAGLHMQLLTQAREAGVLDERQRMAREIHDTVAQGLAGIIAQLHAADNTDGEARRRHLDSAAALAHDSLTEARRTVRAIGPPMLETSQLSEALEELSASWAQSHRVPVEMVTSGEAKPMHPEVEVTLLRIAQESLANVAKHAEAGRVGITLTYMEDQLALDVRDDGLGFEPGRAKATARNGYGLSAMRQRVGRLAGRLSIESEPGRGTVVSASVPAVPQAAADA